MKPLYVVVAHGDAERREAIARALRQADYNPLAAASAGAAAESLAAEVDALLLDLALPDLDLSALRRVLSSGEGAEPDSLEAAERRHLALVLRHTEGNKRRAAHILGISRSTLLNKVRKYGLEER
ncbi:MAG TPA: helix-turn-helix domain-containing protein [Gemmatimonadales bacterium]